MAENAFRCFTVPLTGAWACVCLTSWIWFDSYYDIIKILNKNTKFILLKIMSK